MMKSLLSVVCVIFSCLWLPSQSVTARSSEPEDNDRTIDFPDIPGYVTLTCDLHMHTVFSDGNVWPGIRVEEAIIDGLDVISITDHLEYQPHGADLPHPDRNRSYELASEAALNTGLIVLNGAEITRSMPPGHFNAIFLEDANALNLEDPFEVFREAKRQGAFVFWNHPHWTSQKPDGVAELTDMHVKLLEEDLFQGIEIYNGSTYSDEALDIARANDLAIMGTSDVHGLIDWQYLPQEGRHRPVTLAFAADKSLEALKEAFFEKQTVVWFDNTLVGNEAFLVPLIEQSLVVTRYPGTAVETLQIENLSDADYILENQSRFTFHDHAGVFILKAHETTTVRVKTGTRVDRYKLSFKVLNAFTSPGDHPEIVLYIL
jgi:predicted metal-dependent phosphoesterase TrpH